MFTRVRFAMRQSLGTWGCHFAPMHRSMPTPHSGTIDGRCFLLGCKPVHNGLFFIVWVDIFAGILLRARMFERITPINKALIITNVIVFVLQNLPGSAFIGWLFALWPLETGLFKPWQIVTYGFLHGGWAHLFFNMFALFMFGSEIER